MHKPTPPTEITELSEVASPRTAQVFVASASHRMSKRPPWRTQHLTNALFRAFRRTAHAHDTRTRSGLDHP